ncbi:MAG: hypothetical protein ACOCXA_06205 [Planctomycetota bacterium]
MSTGFTQRWEPFRRWLKETRDHPHDSKEDMPSQKTTTTEHSFTDATTVMR